MLNMQRIWINLGRVHARYKDPATFDIERCLVLSITLRQLAFFTNLVPPNFLRNFCSLHSLRWTGSSFSTTAETLKILKGIDGLEEAIVHCYSELHDFEYWITPAILVDKPSLTPEVLSQLRPLKAFEIRHASSRVHLSRLTDRKSVV